MIGRKYPDIISLDLGLVFVEADFAELCFVSYIRADFDL